MTPLSLWFRQFEGLLQLLTYYVWTLEYVGPILIFSPLFHRQLRALFQAAFMSMHVGFSLFLQIGLFPWISIVMNLTFTQGWVWDWLGARLRRPQVRRMTIFYDGECDFCHKVCRLLRTFLILSDAAIVPAQSNARALATMQANDSWVVRNGDGSERVRWDAIRAVFEASPIFFWLAPVIAPRGCGDCVYAFVARNRGRFSPLTARFLPFRPVRVSTAPAVNALAAFFMAFVFVQNLTTVPAFDIRANNLFTGVREAFGLYQNWTMFAPHPEITSAWPVISGILEDGTQVDVYRGTDGAPVYDKPQLVSRVYKNYRWRKYISNIEDRSYRSDAPDFALEYGRYLCRAWNEDTAPGRRLSTFKIHFQVEWTHPPGREKDLSTRRVWRHDCLN